MTECNQQIFGFASIGTRKVEASFKGADVSSEGGLLLLQQMDRRLGLTRELAKKLPDQRDPEKITHGLQQLLQQRIYGLCAGYEDLNDQKQPARGCSLADSYWTNRSSGWSLDFMPIGKPKQS